MSFLCLWDGQGVQVEDLIWAHIGDIVCGREGITAAFWTTSGWIGMVWCSGQLLLVETAGWDGGRAHPTGGREIFNLKKITDFPSKFYQDPRLIFIFIFHQNFNITISLFMPFTFHNQRLLIQDQYHITVWMILWLKFLSQPRTCSQVAYTHTHTKDTSAPSLKQVPNYVLCWSQVFWYI